MVREYSWIPACIRKGNLRNAIGALSVPPDTIDAVLLTNAHLDHSGFLHKLVRQGFCNQIFCTDATVDLTKIMLLDSAKIQMIYAENKQKPHEKNGGKGPSPQIPLYTTQDAQASFPLFTGVN